MPPNQPGCFLYLGSLSSQQPPDDLRLFKNFIMQSHGRLLNIMMYSYQWHQGKEGCHAPAWKKKGVLRL
jgi:hypothetical protein